MSNSSFTDEEILERFSRIVAKSLKIEPGQLDLNTNLVDLGADSLDFLEITINVETEFKISLPEETILETAERIFGEGVLTRDGFITEEGKKLLMHRMPELSASDLDGEVPVSEIDRLFGRVSTWLRMIRWLLEYAPEECPGCGGKPGDGFPLTCLKCGAEIEIPAGSELSRQWVQDYYQEYFRP